MNNVRSIHLVLLVEGRSGNDKHTQCVRAIKNINRGQKLENAWASMLFYIGRPREASLISGIHVTEI